MNFELGIYILLVLTVLGQGFIAFSLIMLIRMVKLGNLTGIETAKQVDIIDRNTYPRPNKKSI